MNVDDRRPLSFGALLATVLVVALFVRMYLQLLSFSVDVPWMDEWEAFRPGHLSHVLNWSWVFAPHNEHRIVFTKLQAWLLLRLGDWNFVTNVVTSFWIYVLLCILCVRYASKLAETNLTLLAVPFTSRLNWENLITGFQSQFHLFLMFFLLAVWARLSPHKWRRWLGVAWIGCSVYSFSSGVFCALAYLALNLVMGLLFPAERRHATIHGLATAALIAVWMSGYYKIAGHPPYVWPHEPAFWDFLLNIVAFGFGSRSPSPAFGLAVLAVLLGGLIWLGRRARRETQNQSWTAQALTPRWRLVLIAGAWQAGILLALASITLGRAAFGVGAAFSSRYNEVGLMLLPLVGAMLVLMIRARWWSSHRRKANVAIIAVLLALCWPYAKRLNNKHEYRANQQARLAGERCIMQNLAHPPAVSEPILCPTIFPFDLSRHLQGAKSVGVRFVTRLEP